MNYGTASEPKRGCYADNTITFDCSGPPATSSINSRTILIPIDQQSTRMVDTTTDRIAFEFPRLLSCSVHQIAQMHPPRYPHLMFSHTGSSDCRLFSCLCAAWECLVQVMKSRLPNKWSQNMVEKNNDLPTADIGVIVQAYNREYNG